MIDADFIAFGSFRLYFTGIDGQAFSSLRRPMRRWRRPWLSTRGSASGSGTRERRRMSYAKR